MSGPFYEFDPQEPCCTNCGCMIGLRDGCEWHDGPRLNVCPTCAVELLEKALGTKTRDADRIIAVMRDLDAAQREIAALKAQLAAAQESLARAMDRLGR